MCCSLSWKKRSLPPRVGRAAPTRPTAWRDVTIPATVPVTRSKPLGALGLLIRGCGRARTLICQRSCQPIGSPNAPNGLARRHDSGHRPCDPLQAVGRVGAAYPRLRARTHSDLPALVPTNRQPQRAQRLGATSRFRPPSLPNAPNGLARRHDSGHRPRDPLQAVGRVGAAYPRRGRGALTSRARSKVLAADARLSACRDVPVAVAGIPARHPLQAVGRVGAAYPRSRAWGLNRIPLDSPRAKVLAAPTRPTAWRDVTAAVASACARKLEAWPTCLVRTAELGDCEESCTAWACRIQLLRSCQGAGSPRHPQAPARCARCRGLASVFRAEADGPPNDCPCCSPPRPVPSRSAASPAACCVSLRDPPRPPRLVACPFEILRVPQRRVGCPFEILSRPAVRARSLSGVSICPRGRGSLVGIVVACTQSRMSGNWAVRVGRLRACAPNCRPAAPITLSPRPWVPCGEAGFLCCVPTSVEFECEAVPLRRAPPRGRGANLAAAPVFQSSGIPPNWPTRGRSCFRMRNAMPARGPPPLRPSRSSRSCSIRTTSSPVSAPRLIGVGDRAGRGVAKECYLVDPASSHMLVSKIKPCMFKKLVVGLWVGSAGPPQVCTGRLVPSTGDALLALTGRVVPPDFDPIVLAFGIGVMINRDSRGHSYFIVRERKLGARRRSDTVLVSTINDADQGLADVASRTPPAPYEKSKFLGSGGSMVARLKLKGIDGRAPPGVEPAA
uniref:Uncharacterized protein n=1 Tax=Populus alba TaxID=43335 RepID=A0A4U5PWW5_POPAL|nr:hypothetical protein D5086_0000172000 [Populus alba]